MSHTLGPWFVDGNCRVLASDERHTIICLPSGSPFNSEVQADARLISAAPELLAALEGIVDMAAGNIQGSGIAAKRVDAARAAIAKARGTEVKT